MSKKNTSLKFLFLLSTIVFISVKILAQDHPQWAHFDAEIFDKAKKENKLVLLHLRANWCHWCHVMEEQTYARKDVIDYLQKNYLPCMEDHDERQDLTSRYSEYGWPATIIFDTDGNELFKEAGYIPAEEFLAKLAELKKNPKPLTDNNLVTEVNLTSDKEEKEISKKTLLSMFYSSIDTTLGGFVFGQKYIEFATFEYVLNNFKKKSELQKWLKASIDNSTGIFDNVWGGVFQYSTNNDWNHVHFEKLLAIQARYLKMYCWYYKLFHDEEALKKAEKITQYVDRFLASSNGGYYNAQDADLIPGQKSKEYFDLNNEERMKKGIPTVDTSVYTNDNAAYAESLFILWAATNKQEYYNKAIKCVDFLIKERKHTNFYKHGSSYTSTISLNDNLAMLKTLMFAYRATQQEKYKTEAAALAKNIESSFNSHKGYFYSYVGNSAIKASYNVTENIEACRLMNYCSYIFHETTYETNATELLNFLTNSALVETLSTEPGILSALDEIGQEPINAAYMFKNEEPLQQDFIKSCIAFPYFYFNNIVYTKETVIEDKKDLFEAFNSNFMVLCTSSYCSSPMNTNKEFSDFLYKRVLADK